MQILAGHAQLLKVKVEDETLSAAYDVEYKTDLNGQTIQRDEDGQNGGEPHEILVPFRWCRDRLYR